MSPEGNALHIVDGGEQPSALPDRSGVVVLDLTGHEIGRFGRFGNQDGQFMMGHDIALGASGEVYVVDVIGRRLQRFLAGSIAGATESVEWAIEKTYDAWVTAANEKDITKWSSFLAEDPYFSPPDGPPLRTTEAILEYYRASFADPEFSLDCEQLELHIADSREMAWARGVCEATFTGSDGNRAEGTSRWFKVWMKQPDGSWKGRVNTWKYVN